MTKQQKMFVVENGVTSEWVDWFPTEDKAYALVNKIENDNEHLKGHHIVRETVKTANSM